MATPLQALPAAGQSAWIDLLSRPFVRDGELAGLIERGIVGVTSNPTIFQTPIADGNAHDEQLRGLFDHETDPKEIFLALASVDVRDASDLLREVFERVSRPATGGCRWRSIPSSPITRRRPSTRRDGCTT